MQPAIHRVSFNAPADVIPAEVVRCNECGTLHVLQPSNTGLAYRCGSRMIRLAPVEARDRALAAVALRGADREALDNDTTDGDVS